MPQKKQNRKTYNIQHVGIIHKRDVVFALICSLFAFAFFLPSPWPRCISCCRLLASSSPASPPLPPAASSRYSRIYFLAAKKQVPILWHSASHSSFPFFLLAHRFHLIGLLLGCEACVPFVAIIGRRTPGSFVLLR